MDTICGILLAATAIMLVVVVCVGYDGDDEVK